MPFNLANHWLQANLMSSEQRSIRVALFCDYYLPGFRAGGPPISISRVVEQETHADIRVITRDRDAEQTQPYSNAAIRKWTPYGRAQVAYLRPGVRDWLWVIRQLREWRPDILYFNSLQSPWYSILPHLLHRIGTLPAPHILLAPRGETSPGARNLKRTKKEFARPFIKRLANHPLTWHASTSLEKAEIEEWWGRRPVKEHRWLVETVPPPPPALEPPEPPSRAHPQIVFASRIDRKKGLRELLEALQDLDVHLELHVHGVVEDKKYWDECLVAVDRLPPRIQFLYFGEYAPTEISSIMSQADLFVFPTYGENFGHVIAEALSVGCPIAIPDTTPWTDVVRQSTGWVTSGPGDIKRIVLEVTHMNHPQLLTLRRTSFEAYSRWFASRGHRQKLFQFDNFANTDSEVPIDV